MKTLLNGLVSSLALGAVALGALQIAVAADAPAPSPAYVVPASASAAIKKAVENPARSAEHKARDFNRKPAEVLALSGVKPGDKVVEFAAFGQYFTTLLSDVVGPKGSVLMLDLPYTEKRAGEPSRKFVAEHPNAKYEVIDYNKVELPSNVDSVWNVLYYHDLPLNDIDTAALNAKIFKALKPGGTFFVIDHNAEAGSGTRDTKALHRIDPAVIRAEVTKAGFEVAQESKLLAHPTDDYKKGPFDPALRGLTDQTIFVFRKPAK
ncbi:MAG: class I SAM-dependent methyltransferase [Steroidobacteraceae bacterium]